MLSKVFNSTLSSYFKAQPYTLSNAFNFCVSSFQRQEFHPLRNRIMGLSSFDEFTNFFREKGKQFDASCFSMASRTLAKILIESRVVFDFHQRQAIKDYLAGLQKVDMEVLNLQQFSQFLYLLRIIKQDPLNNNFYLKQYIRSILERSESKLKELESETNMSRLSYFYQEYSNLGKRQSNTLARRINQLIRSNNPQIEAQNLNLNEINLLLKGMRSKKNISFDELLLLKNVIRAVKEKNFDRISFFELAQISVAINQINAKTNNDILSVPAMEQIHRKVLSNIDQMDQKSIMYILNGQKTPNGIYKQIYKVIFEKIMDEIQPNGQSSFNELFTMRLFNGISNKIRLHSTSKENQDKFFAFFNQTITKAPRFINSFVENFVDNGFFNNKHLLKLQEALQSIPDFNFRITILHSLAKKRVDISKLANIDTQKNIQLKDKNLIMMTFIVQNMIENNPNEKEKLQTHLQRLKERFFTLYKIEDDSFSKLLMYLPGDVIETLNRALKKELDEKLPNPLETEKPQKYRAAWIKLQVFGNSESHFSRKLLYFLKDKITTVDLTKLVKTISTVGYSKTDSVSNILNLISKRFDLLAKDQELIKALSFLMTNEINSIFEYGSSEQLKNRYWHILSDCLEKLEPSQFFNAFTPVINQIRKIATYDFMYSSQYQNFLMKALQKSELIKHIGVASNLLEECIKLNLIKRQDIQSLSPDLIETLDKTPKLLLKMIESNDFALEGYELNKENLALFLFNNSEKTKEQLQKNRQKILNIISEMKIKEVWKCLVHYRLGYQKNEVELLEALLKQFCKYKIRYEDFSPIFLAQVFKRNSIDRSFVKLDEVKGFLKGALDYFTDKRNIGKIPLEDQIELAKLANEFKVRSESYIHELLNYFQENFSYFLRELYLLAGNLGVVLSSKEMQKLQESNFFVGFHNSFSKSLSIFLLNENELPKPQEKLKSIIDKYNEVSANEKVPVYSIYYEYLKATYPEETKDWKPNIIDNADFCRSIQTLNLKSLLWMRQILEQVTHEKLDERVVSHNYYYKFRNVGIAYPYQTKFFGENNLLRKMLTKLTGMDKFIILNKRQTGVRSTLKYILQIDEKLLSADEQAEIIKRFDAKIQQRKKTSLEEDFEEVADESEEKTN